MKAKMTRLGRIALLAAALSALALAVGTGQLRAAVTPNPMQHPGDTAGPPPLRPPPAIASIRVRSLPLRPTHARLGPTYAP